MNGHPKETMEEDEVSRGLRTPMQTYKTEEFKTAKMQDSSQTGAPSSAQAEPQTGVEDENCIHEKVSDSDVQYATISTIFSALDWAMPTTNPQ